MHPGPGAYSPQVDRQGTLTFGKKKGTTPPAPSTTFQDMRKTDSKTLAKSMKLSKGLA